MPPARVQFNRAVAGSGGAGAKSSKALRLAESEDHNINNHSSTNEDVKNKTVDDANVREAGDAKSGAVEAAKGKTKLATPDVEMPNGVHANAGLLKRQDTMGSVGRDEEEEKEELEERTPGGKDLEVRVSEEDDSLLYGPRPEYVDDALDVANSFEVVMRVKNYRDELEKVRAHQKKKDGDVLPPLKSDPVVTPDGYKFGLILFPNGIVAKPNQLALFLEWRDPPEDLQQKLGLTYSRRIKYRLEVVKHPIREPMPGSKRKRPADSGQDVANRPLSGLKRKSGLLGTAELATDDEEEDDDDVYGDGRPSKTVAKKDADKENCENVPPPPPPPPQAKTPNNGSAPSAGPGGTGGDKEEPMDIEVEGSTPGAGEHSAVKQQQQKQGHKPGSETEGESKVGPGKPARDALEVKTNGVDDKPPMASAGGDADPANAVLKPPKCGPAPRQTTEAATTPPTFTTTINAEFAHTDDWKAENTDWGSNGLVSVDHLTKENGFLDEDGTLVLRAKATPLFERYSFNTKRHTGKVGLENDGATCYLNSLLQTLFMTKKLRLEVYDLDTTHEKANSGVALELQRLFWQLQTSEQSVSTRRLTTAFGWKSTFLFRQHDVQEMNRELVDKLEERMKGTSSENLTKDLYTGKMRSYIKCINVAFESARDEEYYDIQLDVKNMRNVYEAFAKYIEVERLDGDNQYEAEGHGKQDALKGVGFLSFPPVLNLHLKRFEFDLATETTVKINDEFRFPVTMRLDRFLHDSVRRTEAEIEADPQYDYVLHSVLVHWGDVNSGHYYAFINDITRGPDGAFRSRWLKFDDEKVYPATMQMAVSNNFGGATPEVARYTLSGNAYMLVYIRKDALGDVLVDVPDERVPRHLLDRFVKDDEDERLEDERRERLRATVAVRYITHETLRTFYGYERGPRLRDLVDFFRDRDGTLLEMAKSSSVQDLLESLAPLVGVTEWRHLRFWNLIYRENNSHRIDRAFGEPHRDRPLSEVFHYTANEPMPKVEIFVELWEASLPFGASRDKVEWPPSSRNTLLFFRQWRPGQVGVPKKLEHVGQALVSKEATFNEVAEQVARELLPKAGYRGAPVEASRYRFWELCTTKRLHDISEDGLFVGNNSLQHGDIVIFEILPAESGEDVEAPANGASPMEIEEKGVEVVAADAAKAEEAASAAESVRADETPTVFFDTMILADPVEMSLEPRRARASSRLEVLDDPIRVKELGPVRVRQDFTKLTSAASYMRGLDQRFVFSVVNYAHLDMDKAVRMEMSFTIKIEKARGRIARALSMLGEIDEKDEDHLRLCVFNNHVFSRKFSLEEPATPVTIGENLHRSVRGAVYMLPNASTENVLMYELLPCRHEQVDRIVEACYVNGPYPSTEKVMLYLESSEDAAEQGFQMLGDMMCEKLGAAPGSWSVRWIVEDMDEVKDVYGPEDEGDPLILLPSVDQTRTSMSCRLVADIVRKEEGEGEFGVGVPLHGINRGLRGGLSSSSLSSFGRSATGSSMSSISSTAPTTGIKQGLDEDGALDLNLLKPKDSPDPDDKAGTGSTAEATTLDERKANGGPLAEEEVGAAKAPSTATPLPPPPPPPSLSSSRNGAGETASILAVVRHFYSPTPSKLRRAKIFGLPFTLIIRSGDTAADVLERATLRLGLTPTDTASWRVAVMKPNDLSAWEWLEEDDDAEEVLLPRSAVFRGQPVPPVLGLFHPNPQREAAKPNGGLLSKVAKVDARSPVINSPDQTTASTPIGSLR